MKILDDAGVPVPNFGKNFNEITWNQMKFHTWIYF